MMATPVPDQVLAGEGEGSYEGSSPMNAPMKR